MKHKFVLLDGLRGLAAIAVVMYHADVTANRTALFSHGYLAVDFFFMLSGFVIAYNYQARLDTAWAAKDFFKVRLLRLYPLYLLGLIMGGVGLILRNHVSHTITSTQNLIAALTLGALLLPIPQFLRGGTHGAFPLDYPAWSLFAEAVANVFHAFLFRRRSTAFVLGSFFVFAVFTSIFTFRYQGLSFGFYSNEILLAIPRVLMSYTAGILVFRFWASKRPAFPVPGWTVCAVLMLPLLSPRLGSWNAIFDLLTVIVAFPVFLLGGAVAKAGAASFRHVCEYAGKTSYAIYIVHVPLLTISILVGTALRHQPFLQTRLWTDAAFPLLALTVATVAYKKYDEPVRSAFSRLRPASRDQKIQASVESTI